MGGSVGLVRSVAYHGTFSVSSQELEPKHTRSQRFSNKALGFLDGPILTVYANRTQVRAKRKMSHEGKCFRS